MIFLWIVLSILALIVFLLFCPLTLRLTYCESFKATLFLYGIPIRHERILKFFTKDEPKQKNAEKKPSKPKEKTKLSETLSDFTSFLKAITRAFKSVLVDSVPKHLSIKLKQLHVRVATQDAAKTALLYGTIHSAAETLVDLLLEYTRFSYRKGKVQIVSDFQSTACKVDFCLSLTICPIHLFNTYSNAYLAFMQDVLDTPNESTKSPTKPRKDD